MVFDSEFRNEVQELLDGDKENIDRQLQQIQRTHKATLTAGKPPASLPAGKPLENPKQPKLNRFFGQDIHPTGPRQPINPKPEFKIKVIITVTFIPFQKNNVFF